MTSKEYAAIIVAYLVSCGHQVGCGVMANGDVEIRVGSLGWAVPGPESHWGDHTAIVVARSYAAEIVGLLGSARPALHTSETIELPAIAAGAS